MLALRSQTGGKLCTRSAFAGVVVKVLQNLLHESIPIRDISTIVQTLSEYARKSQEPDILTAAVRISLKRLIVQEING